MTISEGGAWRSPDVARCMPIIVNVDDEEFYANIRAACKRPLPWLQQQEAHEGHAVIVGGGPSIKKTLEEILWRYNHGQKIIALNNTAQWLIERGIIPHYHVLLDARESNARFVQKRTETHYLIASQCHAAVFEAAENNMTLWHPNVAGIKEIIGNRQTALVGGGTTVGLQAMSIAYALGFRHIHLHGYDSCYSESEGHAYAQPENDGDEIVKVHFSGSDYHAARWMVNQADEFKSVLMQLVEHDCVVTVAGDGLIPDIARKMSEPAPKILNAAYDLDCSPASYDFLSFLCAAEKDRIERRLDFIDVTFVPGSKYGFRNDNLPPDTSTRQAMLWRICVASCRLLPSVWNVHVLKHRTSIEGDVFPNGWAFNEPQSCYGTHLVKTLPRALRATDTAKKAVARKNRYVTFTIRNCDYWPSRNSNLPAWEEAAKYIESLGIDVVWIRDANECLDALAWDVDLRLAAYEGAICNLLVVNGPIDLLRLSNAPYIAFEPMPEGSIQKEIYKNNGISVGDQFGPNGFMVWEPDTAENIIGHFRGFMDRG